MVETAKVMIGFSCHSKERIREVKKEIEDKLDGEIGGVSHIYDGDSQKTRFIIYFECAYSLSSAKLNVIEDSVNDVLDIQGEDGASYSRVISEQKFKSFKDQGDSYSNFDKFFENVDI